jgi:hypothetical protein
MAKIIMYINNLAIIWQFIGEECKNLIPKKRELTT